MALNQDQKDLFFGTLLGDGSLQTETNGRTWRYRAIHKSAHVDYLNHKYNIVLGLQPLPSGKSLCSNGLMYGQVFDDRTGKIYERHYFNTTVDPALKHFGNLFYIYDKKQRKIVKIVPSNQTLNTYLTPRAIAYWYMDDGALKWLGKSNAMRICTESFMKQDVARLREVLLNKYGIKSSQHKKTRDGVYIGDRILIPEASATVFRNLIEPHLVDCMRYKVSDGLAPLGLPCGKKGNL